MLSVHISAVASSAQHNEISTTKQKQDETQQINTTQWKQATTKLSQHNENKPQHSKISTTQWKQATTQRN